jgi:hypothetical protein
MKRFFLGTILMALVLVFPIPTMARVDVSVSIPLPPLIVFSAPPELIVIPDTYVYVAPDIDVDIYFWNGWWWRPWEGRWYRSHYYNRGWRYYRNVPSFYFDVDPGWRGYYRDRNWYGHRWEYQRIPERRLQQNWRSWNSTRHWERRNTWGVQNYQPRPQQQRQELRHQRQQQYQQRPEVQRQRQPQVQQQKQGQQQKQQQVQHQKQVQQDKQQQVQHQKQGQQDKQQQVQHQKQGQQQKQQQNQGKSKKGNVEDGKRDDK